MNEIETICSSIASLGSGAQTAFIAWLVLKLLQYIIVTCVVVFAIHTANIAMKNIFFDQESDLTLCRMRDAAKIGTTGRLINEERKKVEKKFYELIKQEEI